LSLKLCFTTFFHHKEEEGLPMNIQGFLERLRARKYSGATTSSYALELRKFEHYLREQKLRVNQVRPRHIEAYLRYRDPEFQNRPASTRRRLAVLSSFYDFVVVMANGRIRNPLEAIQNPRRQPPNPRPLTDAQVEILMAGISDARDKAIIALFLDSGLRLSELCLLNRDTIEVEHLPSGRVVGVGRITGKGDKEREFLVDLPALKLVQQYLSERGPDNDPALFLSNRKQRIDKRSIQHMFHTWCERLDLPHLHPHQLRSTFATRLNRAGVPILEISRLLGHASLDTTLAYIKPDARRIRTEFFAAMEQLNG
jgi:integrase/recombinase XerC/integrase/recombinase XerD